MVGAVNFQYNGRQSEKSIGADELVRGMLVERPLAGLRAGADERNVVLFEKRLNFAVLAKRAVHGRKDNIHAFEKLNQAASA